MEVPEINRGAYRKAVVLIEKSIRTNTNFVTDILLTRKAKTPKHNAVKIYQDNDSNYFLTFLGLDTKSMYIEKQIEKEIKKIYDDSIEKIVQEIPDQQFVIDDEN